MGGKTSKTNRTARMAVLGAQRAHFCPTCGERSKLSMHIPGRSMHGYCEGGHTFPKRNLILR